MTTTTAETFAALLTGSRLGSRTPSHAEMLAEQAGLQADAPAALAWIAETLDPAPQPEEFFWTFARDPRRGWCSIYTGPSKLTRFLAVRMTRAALDPGIGLDNMRVFRGTFDEVVTTARSFRDANDAWNCDIL